ncbi:MAG: hypothetical protein AAF844_00135 [Pseudomonadota bacterium]
MTDRVDRLRTMIETTGETPPAVALTPRAERLRGMLDRNPIDTEARPAAIQAGQSAAPTARRADSVARQLGLPAETVERRLPWAEERQQRNQYLETLSRYPRLRDFVSEDPRRARATSDDLTALGLMEEGLASIRGMNESAEDLAFTRGAVAGGRGIVNLGRAVGIINAAGTLERDRGIIEMFDQLEIEGDATLEERLQAAEIGRHTPLGRRAAAYFSGSPERRQELRQRVQDRLQEVEGAQAQLIGAYVLWSARTREITGEMPRLLLDDGTVAPDTVGEFASWLGATTGQAVPFLAASTVAGLLGGGIGGAAGASAALVGSSIATGAGEIAGEKVERGDITPFTAPDLLFAAGYGAIELTGVTGRLFRGVAPELAGQVAEGFFRRAGRRVPANAVEEFINEAGQEILVDFAGRVATGDFTFSTEDFVRYLESGIAGGVVGAGAGAIGAIGGGVVDPAQLHRSQAATQAALDMQIAASGGQRTARVMERIGELAGQSKLAAESPDMFAEWADRVSQGAPDTVYIDARAFDTYFQDAIPDDAARQTFYQGLGVATEIDAQLEANGQLALPLPVYIAQIAPTEHHATISQDVRLRPEDMTPREAAEFAEQADQIIADQVSRILGDLTTQSAQTSAAEEVRSSMEAQLLAAGRPVEEARRGAEIHGAHARVLAETYGIDPVAWYQDRFGLRIVGAGGVNRAGTPANRDRAGGTRVDPDQRPADDATPASVDRAGASTPLEAPANTAIAEEQEAAQLEQSPAPEIPAAIDETIVDLAADLEPAIADETTTFYQPAPSDLWKRGLELLRSGSLRAVDVVRMGRPGPILRAVGLSNRMIALPASKALRIQRDHPAITDAVLDALPARVQDPDFVLRSATEQNSLVIVPVQMDDGRVLVVPIKRDAVDARGQPTNLITSVYVKDDPTWIDHEIKAGRLIYARDRERAGGSAKSPRSNPASFRPGPDLTPPRSQKVLTRSDIVKDGDGTLSQPDQRLNQGPRGAITFDDGETIIQLFESADRSTFLHESAHFFLESLRALAADGNTRARRDLTLLLEWLGVDDPAQIEREHHEKFARGLEAYFLEGAAPTTALRGAFHRFTAWLKAIYRSVSELDVEVSDDVRGVMDRLLSADEAQERQEILAGMTPAISSAEEAGLSGEEYAAYRAAYEEARRVSAEELLRRTAAQIKRERSAEYRAAVDVIRQEETAKIAQEKPYQALEFLASGKYLGRDTPEGVERIKLDRDEIVAEFGEEWLRTLPRGFGMIYARRNLNLEGEEGGVRVVSLDEAATFFGFSNGRELMAALRGLPARRKAIEDRVQRRARAELGDPVTDAEIGEQAVRSIHNDAQARFLEIELRALNRRAGVRVPPRAALKQAAQDAIDAMPANLGTRVARFLMAERKAADEAVQAIAAGNWTRAAIRKKEQLHSHYLYMAARDAMEAREAMLDTTRRLKRKGSRDRIEGPELDQIDQLLERFALKKPPRNPVRRVGLAEWIAEMEAEGYQVAVSPDMRNTALAGRWDRVLTVRQMKEFHDALRNIRHIGRERQEIRLGERRQAIAEAADELVVALDENKGRAEKQKFAKGGWDKLVDAGTNYFVNHIKPEALFEQLDQFEAGGTVHRLLFEPLADAQTAEGDMMASAAKAFREIFSAYSIIERSDFYRSKYHVPEVDRSFSRASLIAVALNWGNVQNREALGNGYGWQDSQVDAILANMTATDWQVVQAIWDHIDSYWPQIAELQRDMAGVVPPKVEPAEVVTPYGTLRGGYYPLHFDRDQSEIVNRREEARDIREAFGGNAMQASTRQGHTIARVGSNSLPVKLDISVAFGHVQQVVHDLTHRRPVMDIHRLVQMPEVREAFISAAGRPAYRMLKPWLSSIAGDYVDPRNSLDGLFRHLRVGASMVNMGFSLMTAIKQPLGISQSIEYVGAPYMVRGLSEFALNAGTSWRFVQESSGEMRNRQRSFDRDVRDIQKRLGPGGARAGIQDAAFWMIGMLDMAVSIPTWLGEYRKAIDEGNSHDRAVARGDQAVRLSQGAGGPKDLARIAAGGEGQRLLTTFYSYFSAAYNLMRRRAILTRRGGVVALPRALWAFLMLVFVPAVLEELVSGRGPEDDEDPAEWAFWKMAPYPALGLIGVRDLVGVATNGFGASTPFTDAVDAAGKGAPGVAALFTEDDEITAFEAKQLAVAAGYLFHLPSRQAIRTVEAMMQDEPSVYEVLVTGPR